MTPLSRHDQVLLAVTAGVLLFGGVGATLRARIEKIASARQSVSRLESRLALQKELINARADWEERYEKVRDRMPVFTPGEQVETYWLAVMDDAAAKHGVRILQRDLKEESEVAGVFELPVEVRSWEATLESFVRFVHALESAGAMLEMRELRVMTIPNRQGWLKGSFTLSCAYMRADDGEKAASAAPPAAAGREDDAAANEDQTP
ncbi:MAG: hypothetical protein IJS46_01780 [Kiritimatiellae bacterium]|nr:hypothetical protein [Kiritimatiellia bacterium]